MFNIHSKHPFLILSTDLRELLTHLKSLGIVCFTYLKNFSNGYQINLSTSPEWIDDYYNLNLQDSSLFEYHPKHYHSNYFLWSSLTQPSEVVLHGKTKYNSDHGITIINQAHDGCEFYFFSGNANHPNIQNVFINNLNVLHHFIYFFKEKFSKDLRKLEKNNILKKPHHKIDSFPSELKILDAMAQQNEIFTDQTEIRQLHLHLPNLKEIKFSPQQTRCIRSLLEFKTAPEIALDLGVNQRTVESYIDEIKLKLDCRTKTDLLRYLTKLIGLNT